MRDVRTDPRTQSVTRALLATLRFPDLIAKYLYYSFIVVFHQAQALMIVRFLSTRR